MRREGRKGSVREAKQNVIIKRRRQERDSREMPGTRSSKKKKRTKEGGKKRVRANRLCLAPPPMMKLDEHNYGNSMNHLSSVEDL